MTLLYGQQIRQFFSVHCNSDSEILAALQTAVCVFSSHPFWTSSSLDVPAGVTQEEGHTGFLIHLPSAVRALILEAVIRTPRHLLDADMFPMFSVGWAWQGVCRDLDACWFE